MPDKDNSPEYTAPFTVTTNGTTINYIYTDGVNIKAKTETVTNIDTVGPTISSEIAEKSKGTENIETKITVQDSLSGLGKIVWYYKAKTESTWRTPIQDLYMNLNGIDSGERILEEKTYNFTGLTPGVTYQFYAEVYDVAGNMVPSMSASNPLEITTTKILVENIALDKTTGTVRQTKTMQLTATVSPDEATDKTIKWTSSNPAVATVSTANNLAGNPITVTGVSEGQAIITATANDESGKSASCTVTVKGAPKPPIINVISGTEGTNGWYKSTVEVTIAPDPQDVGEVQKITYTLSGAQTQSEKEGTSVTISTEGTTTITAWAYVDGMKSNPKTLEIKKDSVPPEINGLTDYTVNICSSGYTVYTGLTFKDTTSGIDNSSKTSSPASVLTGTNQYTYTVSDNAGNTTTGTRKITRPVCFVAGTKVSTPNGLVNIEELKIGDKVYTYNEETKEIEEETITNAFGSNSNIISTITFENGEKIQSTEIHPYYVIGKGWTEAKDLVAGDEIFTQNQTRCKIVKAETNKTEITKVYNITVSGNHNYFVGETQLLVHNAVCTAC